MESVQKEGSNPWNNTSGGISENTKTFQKNFYLAVYFYFLYFVFLTSGIYIRDTKYKK